MSTNTPHPNSLQASSGRFLRTPPSDGEMDIRPRDLRRHGAVLVLLVTVCFVYGCHTPATRPTETYQTVGKDPQRDSEFAHQANARAAKLLAGGKSEEAEQVLKEALAADVMHGPSHNNLGKAYYELGKFYLAAWEFQYAAKLMPDQPEPRNNLGLVLERVGRLDEAVGSYAEAIKLAPDNIDALGNLTRARVKRGDGGPELRELLTRLAFRDPRPAWAEWARERLVLMGTGAAATQPARTPEDIDESKTTNP